MKHTLALLLFFSFALQINAQSEYLLDSVFTEWTAFNGGGLCNPCGGTDGSIDSSGNKYSYDQLGREVLRESKSSKTEYIYDLNSSIRIYTDKTTLKSSKEESRYSPAGGIIYHSRTNIKLASEEYQLDSEYIATRDINDNILVSTGFIYEEGQRLRTYHAVRSYNEYQLIEEYQVQRYNTNTQEPRIKTRRIYEYDENKNLVSRKEYSAWSGQEEQLANEYRFSYDEQQRLISRIIFYNDENELSSKTEIEYFSDYKVEIYSDQDENISKDVIYYSTNARAPFDSSFYYTFEEGELNLVQQESYSVVSDENLDYDYALEKIDSRFDSREITFQGISKYLYSKLMPVVQAPVDDLSFQILGNPINANSYFNIVSGEGAFDKIQIFNMNGKLVSTQNSNGTTVNTFRAPGPSGTYVVRLLNENKVVSSSTKFVVI